MFIPICSSPPSGMILSLAAPLRPRLPVLLLCGLFCCLFCGFAGALRAAFAGVLDEPEACYEMVEDDEELQAVYKVFEQMLDDVDLEM